MQSVNLLLSFVESNFDLIIEVIILCYVFFLLGRRRGPL